ncbi:hypothetical protein HPA12_02080 [Streptococcus suis]|nr:hypothetical protein [Streptococcus suis]
MSVQFVVSIVLLILVALGLISFQNLPTFLFAILVATGCTYLFNYLALFNYRKMFGGQRLCIIGNEKEVLKSIENLMKIENMIFSVTHAFTSDFMNNIESYLSEIDAVYFAGEVGSETEKIYYLLLENNKGIYNSVNFQSGLEVIPAFFQFGDDIFLGLRPFKLTKVVQICKRAFDIFFSLVLQFLTFSIMGFISIAIKLDSKESILYSQERITMNGKHFEVLKFRSMVQNAEIVSGPVFSTSNDGRVTKFGQYLRATRLANYHNCLIF